MIEKQIDLCFDTFPEWMSCSLCAEIKLGQVLRNEFQDADCVECRSDQNRGNSDLFYYLLTKSKIVCDICKKRISCQRIYFHLKDCEVLNQNIISYIDNFIIDEIIKCSKCDQIIQKPLLCKINKCLICSDCQQNHLCEEKNKRNFTLRCKNNNCTKVVLFEDCFHHFVNCEFRIRTCLCGFIGMKHEYKYHKQFCYSKARHLHKFIQQKSYQQHISFLGFKRLQKKEQKIQQKLQIQQSILKSKILKKFDQ